MKTNICIFLAVLILSFIQVYPDVYYYNDGDFSDFNNNENSRLRLNKKETLFNVISDINIYEIDDLYDPVNSVVTRFKIIRNESNIYFLFLNEDDLEFPIYGKGNIVIKKDIETNSFVQMKIFLRNDPEFFIRIFPMDDRSVMDVYINNYPVYRDILLPVKFEDVIFEKVSSIITMAALNVNWNLVLENPDPSAYLNVMDFAVQTRNRLDGLGDVDDGAQDKDGSFVNIESLEKQEQDKKGFNCSGFVKWICDALYYGNNSEYMAVEDLKRKNNDIRGNRWSRRHEDARDPYFGLDWTRNIAIELADNIEGSVLWSTANVDVRDVVFFDYIDNVGYSVSQLKAIMYFLAVNEPGYIYLASFNKDFGEDPVLRQHFHVAAVMPYFDFSGKFHIDIFERNAENTAETVMERYPDDYVHLVRVKVNDNFRFQNIE